MFIALFLNPLLWWGSQAFAKIEIHSQVELMSQPLTTEGAWEIHPEALNPHRLRWAVNRQLKNIGLETYAKKNPKTNKAGYFGVRLQRLESRGEIYIRHDGPWYQSLENFPCSKNLQPEFATQSGARVAGEAAAELWNAMLQAEGPFLEKLLERVSVPSEKIAYWLGNEIIEIWERDLKVNWLYRAEKEIPLIEWQSYLKSAQKNKICPQITQSPSPRWKRPQWHEMMEVSKASSRRKLAKKRPILRAPTRRWDGLMTVRLQMSIAGKKLVGQFLIDSQSPHSLLSPQWLDFNGIYRPYIKFITSGPEILMIEGEEKSLYKLRVKEVTMSGMPLALDEFYLTDVDKFSPPRNPSRCCDGVLGTDFLRKMVSQFETGLPSRMQLWERAQFWDPHRNWIEVSLDSKGRMVSDCELVSVRGRNKEITDQKKSVQIYWSTTDQSNVYGQELSPSMRALELAGDGSWNVYCSMQWVGLKQRARQGESNKSRPKGLLAGTDFIFLKDVVFDLPHGRIWFDRNLPMPKRWVNRSGLNLDYELGPQFIRKVKVKSIDKNSPASQLSKLGLKPQVEILKISGFDARKLGSWDLQRILAGENGQSVTLLWSHKGKKQSGKLQL